MFEGGTAPLRSIKKWLFAEGQTFKNLFSYVADLNAYIEGRLGRDRLQWYGSITVCSG